MFLKLWKNMLANGNTADFSPKSMNCSPHKVMWCWAITWVGMFSLASGKGTHRKFLAFLTGRDNNPLTRRMEKCPSVKNTDPRFITGVRTDFIQKDTFAQCLSREGGVKKTGERLNKTTKKMKVNCLTRRSVVGKTASPLWTNKKAELINTANTQICFS